MGGEAADEALMMLTLRDMRRRSLTRLLPWSGREDPDPHGRQRRTSLFGLPAFAPALPKKPVPSLL
jgi:hypothetical protein